MGDIAWIFAELKDKKELVYIYGRYFETPYLTFSQTTNFKLFQTYSVGTRQFQI